MKRKTMAEVGDVERILERMDRMEDKMAEASDIERILERMEDAEVKMRSKMRSMEDKMGEIKRTTSSIDTTTSSIVPFFFCFIMPLIGLILKRLSELE
jgi:hypothetical protein